MKLDALKAKIIKLREVDPDATYIFGTDLLQLISVIEAAKECVVETETTLPGIDPWFKETPYERLVKALKELEA